MAPFLIILSGTVLGQTSEGSPDAADGFLIWNVTPSSLGWSIRRGKYISELADGPCSDIPDISRKPHTPRAQLHDLVWEGIEYEPPSAALSALW